VLELRLGFPRGGSVGCLFLSFIPRLDVGQVIEGDYFFCIFCVLFYFKSIGLGKCAMC